MKSMLIVNSTGHLRNQSNDFFPSISHFTLYFSFASIFMVKLHEIYQSIVHEKVKFIGDEEEINSLSSGGNIKNERKIRHN